MLPPLKNRTRGESGYPLQPIIGIDLGITELFFKHLTLLQRETEAVTKIERISQALSGGRLRHSGAFSPAAVATQTAPSASRAPGPPLPARVNEFPQTETDSSV
jgi:hypothetical protein